MTVSLTVSFAIWDSEASSRGEDTKMNRVTLVRQDGLRPLHHLNAVQNRTLEIILCSLSGHAQPSKGKTRDCEEVKPSDSCGLNMLSMWVAVFPVDAENMIALPVQSFQVHLHQVASWC